MSEQEQDIDLAAIVKQVGDRHRRPDGVVDLDAAYADIAKVLKAMPKEQVEWAAIVMILEQMEEPGGMPAIGTISLPNLKATWLYEPERGFTIPEDQTLLPDSIGFWKDMTVAQHAAVAKRPFELAEVAHHAMWAAFQVAVHKQDLSTLTWDECVRDTGVLTPFSDEEIARREAEDEDDAVGSASFADAGTRSSSSRREIYVGDVKGAQILP